MYTTRIIGSILILLAIMLWMTPYYGYERATWHMLAAIATAVAGATLLFRGRQVTL